MSASAPPAWLRARRATLGPVHDVRTAMWAFRELRRVRRGLRIDGARAVVGHPPQRVPRRSGQVMIRVLRYGRATCLERSMLRQAWFANLGCSRDIVIGVPSTGAFPAHAWLEGDADGEGFLEVHRLAPGGRLAADGVVPIGAID